MALSCDNRQVNPLVLSYFLSLFHLHAHHTTELAKIAGMFMPFLDGNLSSKDG